MLPAKSGGRAWGPQVSRKETAWRPRLTASSAARSARMKDEKAVTMKNGKPATQGVCPECGTKMFKIGKSK